MRAALLHFRDNYETIRYAGRTKEIRDCPGDSGTVGTYVFLRADKGERVSYSWS